MMTDNKALKGKGDRSRVAAGEGYELGYFARKHGLSRGDAARLIERVGNDRVKLNEAAANFKK